MMCMKEFFCHLCDTLSLKWLPQNSYTVWNHPGFLNINTSNLHKPQIIKRWTTRLPVHVTNRSRNSVVKWRDGHCPAVTFAYTEMQCASASLHECEGNLINWSCHLKFHKFSHWAAQLTSLVHTQTGPDNMGPISWVPLLLYRYTQSPPCTGSQQLKVSATVLLWPYQILETTEGLCNKPWFPSSKDGFL